MKTFLAIIGAYVLFLGILASFGVGYFVLMYGPDEITCNKVI